MLSRFFKILVCWLMINISHANPIQVDDYQQFWLWAGVKPQPVLKHADVLYVHQGLVREKNHTARFSPQGISIPRLKTPNIWLTYRVETLNWPDTLFQQIPQQIKRWEHSGNHISGVQIDFDANTLKLQQYQVFLKQFRQTLPKQYQLSITGLLDWSSNTQPQQLSALQQVVDEVVIQTYRGKQTIPDYQRYLNRLANFPIPFKIGIVQQGEFTASPRLEQSAQFKGYVVFLINPMR